MSKLTRVSLHPGGKGVGSLEGMKKGEIAERSGMSLVKRRLTLQWVEWGVAGQ